MNSINIHSGGKFVGRVRRSEHRTILIIDIRALEESSTAYTTSDGQKFYPMRFSMDEYLNLPITSGDAFGDIDWDLGSAILVGYIRKSHADGGAIKVSLSVAALDDAYVEHGNYFLMANSSKLEEIISGARAVSTVTSEALSGAGTSRFTIFTQPISSPLFDNVINWRRMTSSSRRD